MSCGRTVFPVILQLSLEKSSRAILILEGLVVGGLEHLLKGIPVVGTESHIPYHRLSGAEDQLHVQIHSFEESRKQRQHSHEDQQSKARFLKSTKETFAHCLGTFFISVVCMQMQEKLLILFSQKYVKYVTLCDKNRWKQQNLFSPLWAPCSGWIKKTALSLQPSILVARKAQRWSQHFFFAVTEWKLKRAGSFLGAISSWQEKLSQEKWVITSPRLSQWYQ